MEKNKEESIVIYKRVLREKSQQNAICVPRLDPDINKSHLGDHRLHL